MPSFLGLAMTSRCVLLSVWIVQLSDDVSVHATVRFSIVLVPLSRSLSLDPARTRTITRRSRLGFLWLRLPRCAGCRLAIISVFQRFPRQATHLTSDPERDRSPQVLVTMEIGQRDGARGNLSSRNKLTETRKPNARKCASPPAIEAFSIGARSQGKEQFVVLAFRECGAKVGTGPAWYASRVEGRGSAGGGDGVHIFRKAIAYVDHRPHM
jgi:hypothetical protein